MKKLLIILPIISILFSTDYSSDIQPIFDANCTSCHGNSAGLNLSSYDNVIAGSNNGIVINAGDASGSTLYQRVEDGSMPAGDNPDLSDADIQSISDWINEGALESSSSTVDILYDFDADVAGFQFTVTGATYLSASGGQAAGSQTIEPSEQTTVMPSPPHSPQSSNSSQLPSSIVASAS